ncbi:hypothetical protein Ddye_007960 [Dipteronia dyeriana]|uniref:DUF1985 domain-containing protein n=1 Tax=Dipteronia dyeriana TaxID=168575 RepID=A0AAD9X9G0_9ROSI|nr:hypothetical protein Ddye_007960 [Dipteronia dyeriana]
MTNRLKEMLKTPAEEWYEGKVTCHDHFDVIGVINDALYLVPTEIAIVDRRRFMTSYFEHFMTMHRRMKFSVGVIHRLLLREVHHIEPSNKMHFMLGNQDVRFSKVEFCLITGLRFKDAQDTSQYTIVDNGIQQKIYFGGRNEISSWELNYVLSQDQLHQAYDSVKLCLPYMLNWILMGLDERVKIQVSQFQLMEDLDAFNTFPWGAHVYTHSIFSFKHALNERRELLERSQQAKGADVHKIETYNIYGLSYALLGHLRAIDHTSLPRDIFGPSHSAHPHPKDISRHSRWSHPPRKGSDLSRGCPAPVKDRSSPSRGTHSPSRDRSKRSRGTSPPPPDTSKGSYGTPHTPRIPRIRKRGRQLMSPYTDLTCPKMPRTTLASSKHAFIPTAMVDANQLETYGAYNRNKMGELHNVDLIEPVNVG